MAIPTRERYRPSESEREAKRQQEEIQRRKREAQHKKRKVKVEEKKYEQSQEVVTLGEFFKMERKRLPATHYCVWRLGYQHHFLIADVKCEDSGSSNNGSEQKEVWTLSIIHFTGVNKTKSTAQIKEELIKIEVTTKYDDDGERIVSGAWVRQDASELGKALMGNKWLRIDDPNYPLRREDRVHAVKVARSCIGDFGEYDARSNNCEHFISEVLTGKKESKQVNYAWSVFEKYGWWVFNLLLALFFSATISWLHNPSCECSCISKPLTIDQTGACSLTNANQ